MRWKKEGEYWRVELEGRRILESEEERIEEEYWMEGEYWRVKKKG